MMVRALTSLQKRILSAVIIAPIVLWMIIAGGWPLKILVWLCFFLCWSEWWHLSLKTKQKIPLLIFGIAYIGLAFMACYHIRVDYGLKIAILFIIMVWMSDIGAYFTGKMLKGPKMAPKISPNKTWAGLAGAAFFPGLVGIVFLFVYHQYSPEGGAGFLLDDVKPLCVFLIGALTGVIGQLGDLLISWLKRYAGVKDSGNLIPGHGGLLDRVDSLMLAAIFFVLVLKLYPAIVNV